MNNQRRKTIREILVAIKALEASLDSGPIEAIKSDIESVTEEEQDAFNNLPESLQNGDKGQAMQAAIDALDECVSPLDELLELIGGLCDHLTEKLNEASA